MKRKFLFIFMIASVLFVAGSAMATVVLPTGVDEYRFIFVTSGTYTATSDDISTYNANVTNEAASNAILDGLGVDWYCVGSTVNVDARDNITPGIAWNLEDIPIYNTIGQLVGDNLWDIFNATIQSFVGYDPHGMQQSHQVIWTGSYYNGTKSQWPMGNLNVTHGMFGFLNGFWLDYSYDGPAKPHTLYGISSPVPEPTTVWLLGFGGLALLRRSRRRLHS